MKKLLSLSLFALTISASAQTTLQREVISSAGSTQTGGNVILCATVGQPVSGSIGESSKLSQGFQQNLTAYQQINLREGWGMVSGHVRPYKKSFDQVFSELTSVLFIAKNNAGNVYMTEYAYNGIGDWNYFEGYQYKMTSENELTIRGSRVIPQLNPVSLQQGWNLMGYLRNTPADVVTVMDAIVEDVLIIKDQDGAVYMPEYAYNGIGNFNPGLGYQIKTSQETGFTFPSNTTELRIEQNKHKETARQTQHFAQVANTGSNHTLMIPASAWADAPQEGDELAAYDATGNTVGSIVLQQGHNAMAIWGDDERTAEKEGLYNGELFSLVLYKKAGNAIVKLEISQWETGDNTFSKDGITVIAGLKENQLTGQQTELFQNVPNPLSSGTEIGFFLSEAAKAKITLSNSIGQELMTLTDKNYEKGYHSLNLERESLSPGIYFYSLKTPDKIRTKQLTIIQ